MKQKQDKQDEIDYEIDKLRGKKVIWEEDEEIEIQRKRAKFDPENPDDEERKETLKRKSGQRMAQAARDKKNEFKDNQKNRLSVFLKTAGLSTKDNERLTKAFFDI